VSIVGERVQEQIGKTETGEVVLIARHEARKHDRLATMPLVELLRAIQMALDSAGISPDEIDYVNAHGTSTPLGDASETRVIKLALGEEKAYATPISSTKGATGHCLGASGAIEAIACILAVRDGIVPPTINYEDPDPECDLDYIPNESRETDVRYALSNNFGFGGHNACLVIKRWDE